MPTSVSGTKRLPLEFLRPNPPERKAVAKQHIGAHDQGDREREPRNGGPADISRVDFAEFSQNLLGSFRHLHELHGPIAAIEDGGQRVVFLFSPEYNQQVLSDTERFHARFFTIRGPKRSAQRRLRAACWL